ncbi:hypothetical protein [Sporosarcina luteola]|uniref:hypothetical protein n=1 Tax=Sporosarcina luteola TaxID=582850 RepID=UPI0020416943|nr:hypothetical protein [Sporosarcina luteola]MCM3712354.1 hypothetical protein [Sporosarcina luteola]
MKKAEELYEWGLEIKEKHVGKAFNINIIKRNDEVERFVDEIIYFCDTVNINKQIQDSLKSGIKFVPGQPVSNLERELGRLELLYI